MRRCHARCVVTTFLLAAAWSAATAHAGPNVVIIYADDLGWGDLGCYGHPRFKTPRIDRLAAEGARLTNFYSSYPYCAPSRASLLTGRYPFRSGMTRNPAPDAADPRADTVGIPASELMLGELFQQNGYITSCIGKWHLGHQPQFYPRLHGFHEYFGILYSNDMRPVELIDGERMVEYPVVQATLTKRYTARAVGFIERNKGRPFLLYLPHAMVHKPLAASEAFYKKSGAGLYGDALAELDWGVGKVLDKLKELGLEEQTLVIFTSDNGPWFGGSTGGLRGMKSATYEGGLRVPFIARWPGRIPAGHVSDEPAIIMDVFATVLLAAGIDVPDDRVIDGKNILPLLRSQAASPHDVLYGFRGGALHTVRSGKWKLHIRNPGGRQRLEPDEKWIDPRGPDGVTILAPFEQAHPSDYPGVYGGDAFDGVALFDLRSDPAEQHNVAAEFPEVVSQMRAYSQRMEAQMQD